MPGSIVVIALPEGFVKGGCKLNLRQGNLSWDFGVIRILFRPRDGEGITVIFLLNKTII
jgi:hypothetical protein